MPIAELSDSYRQAVEFGFFMALSATAVLRVLRAGEDRAWTGRRCVWKLISASCFPADSPIHMPSVMQRRSLHLSPAALAKNMLNKFASKTKKKFWYDSPSIGTQFVNKPDSLLSLMKVQKKQRREDSIRMRALNSIMFKALTDLLSTPEVSQEVYNLNVELSKVCISADFSACRAYWITSGVAGTDNQVEEVLQKYAPRFRYLLLTHQVLGSVPPIVFVRDRENAMIQEVERLLAVADFGEDYGDSTSGGHSEFRETSLEEISEASAPSSPSPDMFGIDHAYLNRQILEYKSKMKDHLSPPDSIGLSQQQQEQLAEIRRQKILKKKLKKQKAEKREDDDITPQKYLLDKYIEEEEDVSSAYPDIEDDINEVTEELEEKERKTRPLDEH
ncbi:putative ribosome-binding factor A, mitochondrial [Spea bombifrons]|uniref:putative ribosome-binding factor A, mitochondrial n=1 Tax=Spea bombifrons TaxID=233779 RepID=UPI00234AB7E4|nr:putative ribosome-binding factor A, mitochondrial [Spea bombifrons]